MTTPDLYAHLNIPRSASAADIRRAYRARSKQTHPDAGGSEEEFAITTKALSVLTDPARRAKYDATGDTTEAAIDNSASERAQLIVQLFDAVCQQAAKSNLAPWQFDVADAMRELAARQITESRANRKQAERNLAAAEKIVGRFKRRKKRGKPAADGAGDNLLDRLMQGRCDPFRQQIRQIDEAIAKFEAVLETLKEYDFAFDAAPPQQSASFFTIRVG